MQRIHRYLGTVVLGATLVAPAMAAAPPRWQDDRHEEKREERAEKREHKYYDREHKDYHVWSNHENEAYERWQREERHEQSVRPYARLNRHEQNEYWNWRHRHPDNDRDHDHDHDHR